MAITLKSVRAWLLFGGCTLTSLVGQTALAQQPDLISIQQQLLAQQEELRSLRAKLNATAGDLSPLPSVGIGEIADYGIEALPVADDKGAKDDKSKKKSAGDRLADIEKTLKKQSDDAKKKKAADAEKPALNVRGKFHTDVAMFDQDPANIATVGDALNGVDFRRARIGVDGKILDIHSWRVEMDFAVTGRPGFTDVFWRVSDLPYVNNAQIGHYKEWFSLEELTGDDATTFMERALPNAFAPSRNWGVSLFDYFEGEEATWAVGAFKERSDAFGDQIGDNGGWAVTSRGTGLLWYDEPSEGRYLMHVGGAFSYRDPDETNPIAFSTNLPEVRMAETGITQAASFLSTGNIIADDAQVYSAEAAWVYGPLSVQGEYIQTEVNRSAASDLSYNGGYLEASYFLTGENRNYNRKNGFFDLQKVYEPFFCVCTPNGICKGSGAWQVAGRVSYIDLDDGGVGASRGNQTDYTAGLNWYLNTNIRVLFNYIHADLDRAVQGESEADVFAMRFDVHF